MELAQAERLSQNQDFVAFLKVVNDDVESIKEDLVYHTDPMEIMRTQCKIQVLRGISGRLNHVIENLKPEAPASDQDSVSPA